jgi:hypothetical protein
MFTNIEQIENEVSEFRENMSATKEIVQSLQYIKTLEGAAEKNIAQLREVSAQLSETSAQLSEELPAKVDEANTELVKKALTKLIDIQAIYTKSLEKSNEEFSLTVSQAVAQLGAGISSEEIVQIRELCEEIKVAHKLEIASRQAELENARDEVESAQSAITQWQREIEKQRQESECWQVQEADNRRREIEEVTKLVRANAIKLDDLTNAVERIDRQEEPVKPSVAPLIPVYIGVGIAIVLSVLGVVLQ